MSDSRLSILQHALGLDRYGQGQDGTYRRHYVAGRNCSEWQVLMTLVEDGLMIRHEPSELTGGGHCFVATDAGRDYVRRESPDPPKINRNQKRYLDWLKVSDPLNCTFGEYLKRGLYKRL